MTDLPPDATVRRSPLHDTHVAAGAAFTDFAGWQMPVRYSGDLAEHTAVRRAAGLFDLSHMGEILVVGPDAAAALDYALAGPMSALQERQAKYTLLLAENGGILDDLVVYRTGVDRYLVVANASNRGTVAARLRERVEGFDAVVEDESDDIGLLALQGPRALEILQNLDGLDLRADIEDGSTTPDALAALRYYRCIRGEFEGRRILIARTGYTGEDGFELYTAPESLRALWTSLLEIGAGAGLVPAGLAARDSLRLEAGMPLYGHELGLSILPAQAGLGRAVSLDGKGDFVGRAALESGRPADPASEFAGRVLVGLAAEGKRAPRAGYAIYNGQEDRDRIGVVTSGLLSPTLGHPIALAYVDEDLAAPGTVVSVDVRGTRLPATITSLPFYRRDRQRGAAA
ncbi:glycine cleavage system aminomethyltransferase GcvT [Naasia sp. SYSU D00948]|uniref:glycine cleavage system aminomethyltransferase GcvT n=1 Tax=Naasia sp. SYSU D00948 TaxID=2817379 RepID=UPI001B30D330|nr:glycine cleavage system aminomethyltransferase GcvT [Naasia sp. SYSU D00948]